jgi:hypothetical protein
MADPAAALATQLKNIESRTGKRLDELRHMIAGSGLHKHGEIRSWLMGELALGYGDANALAHLALKEQAPAATPDDDPLDAIYAGPKAALRPLHERVMAELRRLGTFEVAPKKTYLSLRRRKQFAMLGPATKDQIEIGLNVKELPAHPRLKPQPAGKMCNFTLRLSQASEVDATLRAWLRAAFDAAG